MTINWTFPGGIEELYEGRNHALLWPVNMGNDNQWIESYIDRMMKDEKQVDSSYRKIITGKLFNLIESMVTPGEETTPEESFGNATSP